MTHPAGQSTTATTQTGTTAIQSSAEAILLSQIAEPNSSVAGGPAPRAQLSTQSMKTPIAHMQLKSAVQAGTQSVVTGESAKALNQELITWICEVPETSPERKSRVYAAQEIAKIFRDQGTELNLCNYNLTTIPSCISRLITLEKIDLQLNQLSELPASMFQGLISLKKVYLGFNQLTRLPEGLFRGLTKLEVISCRNNQLAELSEQLFDGLTAIKKINFASNRIAQLPERLFQGLTRLQEIDYSHNQLTQLPDELLQALSALQTLYFGHNQLGQLSAQLFQGLAHLQTINLEHNQLTYLPSNVFEQLTAIQRIDLRENQLTQLPEALFRGLTQLATLSLDHNQLARLPDNLLQGLSRVQQLSIEYNHLQRIPRTLTQISENAVIKIENNPIKPERIDADNGSTQLIPPRILLDEIAIACSTQEQLATINHATINYATPHYVTVNYATVESLGLSLALLNQIKPNDALHTTLDSVIWVILDQPIEVKRLFANQLVESLKQFVQSNYSDKQYENCLQLMYSLERKALRLPMTPLKLLSRQQTGKLS